MDNFAQAISHKLILAPSYTQSQAIRNQMHFKIPPALNNTSIYSFSYKRSLCVLIYTYMHTRLQQHQYELSHTHTQRFSKTYAETSTNTDSKTYVRTRIHTDNPMREVNYTC